MKKSFLIAIVFLLFSCRTTVYMDSSSTDEVAQDCITNVLETLKKTPEIYSNKLKLMKKTGQTGVACECYANKLENNVIVSGENNLKEYYKCFEESGFYED